MGNDDKKNQQASENLLVSADEYPDFEDTLQDGKHAGVIGVGGLCMVMPLSTKEERTAYYTQKNNDQQSAIDNDMMREQHPSMPIMKPDRQSRVTFGAKDKNAS